MANCKEEIIYCFMTSQDAAELAKELARIEAQAQPGDSALARIWQCGDNISIKFLLDQDRARKKGLM